LFMSKVRSDIILSIPVASVGALQEELLKLGNEGYSDNNRWWTVGFFLAQKMKMLKKRKHRTRTLWRKQVREDARKTVAKWHEKRKVAHDRIDLVRFKVLLVASIITVCWYVI
jgi:hypothetical protein